MPNLPGIPASGRAVGDAGRPCKTLSHTGRRGNFWACLGPSVTGVQRQSLPLTAANRSSCSRGAVRARSGGPNTDGLQTPGRNVLTCANVKRSGHLARIGHDHAAGLGAIHLAGGSRDGTTWHRCPQPRAVPHAWEYQESAGTIVSKSPAFRHPDLRARKCHASGPTICGAGGVPGTRSLNRRLADWLLSVTGCSSCGDTARKIAEPRTGAPYRGVNFTQVGGLASYALAAGGFDR